MPPRDISPTGSSLDLSVLLAVARDCAHAAGQVTLRYFGSVVEADSKDDGTPVTRADREAETLIRDMISKRFPHHGVLGEEFGQDRPEASVRWIIDPIDGTKSFMHGVPLYGVLIGVEVEGAPAVGVVHFPALNETIGAARGLGCDLNGRPTRVSSVERLSQAVVLTTSLDRSADPVTSAGLPLLVGQAKLARTWGDCYGHALVATGRAEVMVDPRLSSWDAGPLLTIVTEAGGRFTDVQGEATIHGGSGVSTNGLLHDEVLATLARTPSADL